MTEQSLPTRYTFLHKQGLFLVSLNVVDLTELFFFFWEAIKATLYITERAALFVVFHIKLNKYLETHPKHNL